jgi:hypothetical protein
LASGKGWLSSLEYHVQKDKEWKRRSEFNSVISELLKKYPHRSSRIYSLMALASLGGEAIVKFYYTPHPLNFRVQIHPQGLLDRTKLS